MKLRLLGCLLLTTLVFTPVQSGIQNTPDRWPGFWAGRLSIDDRVLNLVIEIDRGPDGLSASMSLPDRGLLSRPFARLLAADDSLQLELDDPILGTGTFSGSIRERKILSGDVEAVFTDGRARQGRFTVLKAVKLSEQRARSIAGSYQVEELGRVDLTPTNTPWGPFLRASSLMLGSETMLYTSSESEFIVGLDPDSGDSIQARIVIEGDPAGEVSGLRVFRGGRWLIGRPLARELTLQTDLIERRLRAFLSEMQVPSYTVGVVAGDKLLYSRSFGFANLEEEEEATPATLYQIGSLTKVFTAAAMIVLRDEGRLRLDDAVESLLPADVRLAAIDEASRKKLTLRRLVTHISGLPRDPPNLRRSGGRKLPYETDDLYAALPEIRLEYPVGQRWSYSNLAFGLLGHALSRAAGSSFEELLRDRILRPLEMNNTAVRLTPSQLERFATHYWAEDDPRRARPRWEFGEIAGNGGLVSTVGDLARFLSLQLMQEDQNGAPVSIASLAELHAVQQSRGAPDRWMGLGWWVDYDDLHGWIVSHGGEVDGHSCHLAFSPLHRVGAIVLANLGGAAGYVAGDWLIKEVIRQAREQTSANVDQAVSLYNSRQWGDTAWANQAIVDVNPGDGAAQYRLGLSRFYLRQLAAAEQAFQSSIGAGYAQAAAHYMLTRIWAIRGDLGRAFQHLSSALEAGYDDFPRIEQEPELDLLRRDARFHKLRAGSEQP